MVWIFRVLVVVGILSFGASCLVSLQHPQRPESPLVRHDGQLNRSEIDVTNSYSLEQSLKDINEFLIAQQHYLDIVGRSNGLLLVSCFCFAAACFSDWRRQSPRQ